MPPFQVIIIGAGIAGLATAISLSQKTKHEILVLESSPILTEAGAGIQISAAASRPLTNWGLRAQFEAVATAPEYMEIRRYQNGNLLGLIPANVKGYSVRLRGFPHWLVHRVDYQRILADEAIARGVKILFGHKVSAVDTEECKVVLDNGRTLMAGLIIGADGIHSRTRQSIPATKDIAPRRSENFCYRALIPREKMLSHPLTSVLITNESQVCWAGHLKHIIAYPIAKGKFYNLVMPIPDHGDAPLGNYNQPGNVSEMREEFKGFDETVNALLSLVNHCAKWTLAELPPLPTWSSSNGRVILVGDACHAMVPHAASGAATSLEDAEVLGLCLAACKEVEDLPKAAQAYEHLRKARCERIQEISRQNATTFSLPDGPVQQMRDQGFQAAKAALEKELAEGGPRVVPEEDSTKPFPHPSLVQWLVGHNVTEEANGYLASRQAKI